MRNFLLVILVISLIVGLYFAFTFDWFKIFNPSTNTTLEEKNKELMGQIEDLEHQRDSLKPLIEKYELRTDSLLKIDSTFQIQISLLKSENIRLERRLQSSKDSANKYKNIWRGSKKKYQELKKNQKKPTNQQTLEFFKKY
jgi:chromosome segregation ATPase